MATKGMYKLDDGNCCPTNCFPVRSLLRPRYEEGAGHWQVARRSAEKTKIELLFGTKPTQFKLRGAGTPSGAHGLLDDKTLDGAHLIKLHHVKSPSHLCSVDISNQNFVLAKEDEFEQFNSVAYINATENLLTLEVFRKFPGLRELELSLNGLRNLKVNAGDFPHLEILDLSYNNLSPEDVQVLGVLSHLKVLHLTANGLSSLPLDLAVPESENCPRFPALEVLLLDDNHLSHPDVFVSLANLQSLKQLNLDKNGIKEVPYLHHMDNSRFSIHPLSAKSGIREGLRSRKSAGKHLHQDSSPSLGGQPEYIIFPNSKDPDRTEIAFPSWSPDPPTEENSPSPRVPSKASCASFSSEFTLPLPELRFLSLANNQIEHEEDLLAVALFPSLTELTFHGNPFTTSRSGDPPLLTSFLQNKLGIKMVRKKISKLEKPRILIPNKANRKVKAQLPKVQKRPLMLEASLETTFWQLWTGSDLDPNRKTSVDEPLPPIRSFSIPYDPKLPIIPTLKKEEISAPISLASFVTDASATQSSLDQPENVPVVQPSLTKLLSGNSVASSLEQIVSESLPPRGSFLEEQSQSGLAGPTEMLSAQQELSSLPEENPSEPSPPIRTPSEEQLLSKSVQFIPLPLAGQDQFEPVPPPNSPLQEQDLSEALPTEPYPLPNSPLPERNVSEPVPPTESLAGEQDLPKSFQPVRSVSVEQDLSEASPPIGSPTEEQDQSEPIPPASSAPQGLDLSEPVSPTRSSTGVVPRSLLPATSPEQRQDQVAPTPPYSSASKGLSGPVSSHLSGTILPTASPAEGQEQIEPAPPRTSAVQAEGLSEPISPSMLPTEGPDLSEPLPPMRSPPAEDHLEPIPLPSSPGQEQNLPERIPSTGPPAGEQVVASTPIFREPNWSEPEPQFGLPPVQEEPLKSPPISFSPEDRDLVEAFPLSRSSTEEQRSLKRLPPSQSSSRELYLLFARVQSGAMPLRALHGFSSEYEMLSSSEEFLEAEESESFFMTQVDEEESSSFVKPAEEPSRHKQSSKEKQGSQQVPEKYKGYEELLGGDPGPDFIEPVGIQHNVRALEKALRYPRVYRESKARLDSFQKPYAPAEKKVLRIPVPPAQKSKGEKLEEILLKMREPTNTVELPLVCILRQKKDNWREYREALALLQEFRKEYRAAVATCNVETEAKQMSKKHVSTEKISQSVLLRNPPEVKMGGKQLEASSVTEENKLSSILSKKDSTSNRRAEELPI
ncbi:X-ray radiation resistance-associated protein 1 isoform X2 [Rhineura floridana]|uniref:X-ray radiation resistance-associated protein 1 isoform X2 n=1 Tax=Rhineura floridana TaxID=261503 RepID=UPI002AC7ECF1|nr:X-ray radiation resistance-associated protein 1 isoform X2 [Rhineura floridana]